MGQPITLSGVKDIRPATNENSMIITFWNDQEVAVSNNLQLGVNDSLDLLVWPQR